MEGKKERHIERIKLNFATFNILSVMKSAGKAVEHNDLVARVMVRDGNHGFFESPEEYQKYVLAGIERLHNKRVLSMKYGDDDCRYGLMPKNRPEKRKAEYGED